MSTSTYTVVGMTCEHCVRSVTEEVGAIPGVSDLSVDLTTGELTVTSEAAPVADDAVRDAVSEAGYSLT
ncbi:cation-transporting ATPase [Aeromicrobium sp. A1-2]|uniref:heavy-metal-associated domain-containing protein n=1 Tax=Aeromicrobium sp. A1-2 TaxID=2107713 RepID=UPI000E4EE080|nr:heavy-metal-associated domain-containing protein [Aeromicrobium sp. A1-2]AXT86485.1 cation-transporting ATPase [Aeromicrobium sp. A1-2]